MVHLGLSQQLVGVFDWILIRYEIGEEQIVNKYDTRLCT
jgi:hypothetical protein